MKGLRNINCYINKLEGNSEKNGVHSEYKRRYLFLLYKNIY